MKCRIIIFSMAGLAMWLGACISPGAEKENDVYILSTWQLDEKTHHSIVHHCVETEFADIPAVFVLKKKGDDLLLQFNGQHHIWVAPANKKYFYACQVLKSSASGRFCGFQTEISIYFSLAGRDQNKIKGLWRATTCDYCPRVEFIAHRIN
ncbi:hypothetical protein [Gaoshiqia sp. Z1-71]|uniref:hypothetical protein n=1 Tax=Gaoshiqia hydrogeniformans TaxID=3290090 RepID=UPI003BF910E1